MDNLALQKKKEEGFLQKNLSVEDVITRIKLIGDIKQKVMKKDVHYAKPYPAAKKDTLLKPGAEKLAATFRIAPRPKTEDLSTDDEIKYRIICEGYSPDGIFLGSALGECSSNEKKYKWRAAICEEEYEKTDENKKRIAYERNRNTGEIIKIKQIRTNKEDIGNTILKMAYKRAFIALIIIILGASDIFDQDLEDYKENGLEKDGNNNYPNSNAGKPKVKMPQAKTSDNIISIAQQKRFYAISKKSGKTDGEIKDFLKSYGIEHSSKIPLSLYETICDKVSLPSNNSNNNEEIKDNNEFLDDKDIDF